MNSENFRIEIKLSINDINKNSWDNLQKNINNPFYKWEWLATLENSKSVTNETGWQPLYFLAYFKNEIHGAAPLFIKNHSYGEFIFDHSFARLAEDLNLNYYPKLIGMSPYSPIEGYKFFYSDNANELITTKVLINYIELFAKKNNILSCNFLYVDSEWGNLIAQYGYKNWLNIRSEWENSGENSFEDFLLKFNSNQRKNIKKERKSLTNRNIIIETYTKEKINLDVMENMYFFYEQHCSKWGVWGSKYLTNKFFRDILNNKENLLIFSAFDESSKNPIAMSMCIKNNDRLWGRYWGSKKDIDNLHFELCYYQPIEWAIKNKIKYFDPGAGGQHKRRRGFYAKESNSFHKWFNFNMENIIVNWLNKVNIEVLNSIEDENNTIPFKK